MTGYRLQSAIVIAGGLLVATGCGTPSVRGVAGTSPAPQVPWVPPAGLVLPADTTAAPVVPPDVAVRIHQLTLSDIVDIGLRNNPATRLAWANARAAADAYGAARGATFPTLDANVNGVRLKTVASQGRAAVEQSLLNPSLTLSWLVLDGGRRGGAIRAARASLVAADFSHNAAIQDVVLGIELAYYQYVANKALLQSRQVTLKEAQENLDATRERNRVGLATIADVLQAKTAASQAELAMETTEGAVQTARGALAFALGLPATVPYDVDSTAFEVPVAVLTDQVDSLVASAVRDRPDLQAARARVAAARARVTEARSDRLPALQFTAQGGRTYATTIPSGANSYTLSLGLSIPLFAGFTRVYNQRAAEAAAEAAGAQADALGSQVTYQVFSAYYALQTATRSVRTADDLLASAEQSEQVALGRYKAGVGSILDLLSAQSALADARAQRVNARLAWNVSLAQLAHDAGVLDPHGGSPLHLVPDTTTLSPP